MDTSPHLDESDLDLPAAAALAGRSVKTLRRAIKSGRLPSRYVVGRHGPQLVCSRADVDSWLIQRDAEVPSMPASHPSAYPPLSEPRDTAQPWSDLVGMVEQLSRRVDDLARIVEGLRDRTAPSIVPLAARLSELEEGLNQHGEALRDTRDVLFELAGRVASVEAEVLTSGAITRTEEPRRWWSPRR